MSELPGTTGHGDERSSRLWRLLRALHAQSFFSFMVAQGAAAALGFLTTIGLARILPRSEFGVWVYAAGILQLFLLCSGLGMQAAILRFCSLHTFIARAGTFHRALAIGVASSFAAAAVIVGSSRHLPLRVAGADELLLVLALVPLPTFLILAAVSYFQAASRAGDAAAVLLTTGIVQASAILALGWSAGLPGVVIGQYLGPLAGVAAAAWRGGSWPRPRAIRRLARFGPGTWQLLRFGLLSMTAGLASAVLVVMDTVAIGLVLGSSEAVAEYKVAAILPIGLFFLPQAVMQFLIPHFARQSADRRRLLGMLRRLVMALVPINALLTGAIFVAAPHIVGILGGSGYADVAGEIVVPIRILAVGYFFAATLRIPFGNVLFAIGRVGFNLVHSVVVGLVNIGLNLWLVAAFGSVGAAVGTLAVILISSLVSGCYLWWQLRRELKPGQNVQPGV